MNRLTKLIYDYFERQAFGVCAWWGEKLGIASSTVRRYFIYMAFITLGSTLVVYLIMLFFLEHKEYFPFRKRSSIWEL